MRWGNRLRILSNLLGRIIHVREKLRCFDRGASLRSEGTETNSFNIVFGVWLATRNFLGRSLHKPSLRAAPRHRPIAFAPEGSPLDRSI
jgi:hypothetical protein